MNPQDAIDLGREAIKACLMVGGPILLASLIIGLLIGVLQAMTQVQDQTVSFVPKLICLLVVVGVCLPWLTNQVVDYGKQTWETPITHFHGNSAMRTPATQTSFIKTATRPTDNAELPGFKQTPELDGSNGESEELKSPFSLPHYRYARLTQIEYRRLNIDGQRSRSR